MNPRTPSMPGQEPVSPVEVVRGRCAGLGLQTWSYAPDGSLIQPPNLAGPGGDCLRSAPFRQQLSLAVQDWLAGKRDPCFNLFPGLQILFIEHRQGRRLLGLLVAAALGPDLFSSTFFSDACHSASADPELARRALQPLAHTTHHDLPRLVTTLSWMLADLEDAAKSRKLLSEYGLQLTEMYEEIALLYRLGASMNRLTEPEEFVRVTCNELAQTLPFSWIAAKFADVPRLAPGLTGRLFIAGQLPCPVDTFNTQSLSLLSALEPDRWTLLPEGCGAALAATVGAQTLAHPISRDGAVIGALLAGNKRGPDTEISSFETQLLDAAADYLEVFVENADLYSEQQALFLGTIQALTASIDAKDRYTRGHSERVAHLGHRLALAAGLSPHDAERVRLAGLLHDVGKIGVPEAVLTKPGKLTDEEFEQIKLHPSIGHHILRDIPMLTDLLPGVLYHHERWDGRGYPHRVAAENIPLIARILAVADSFDAMSSNRAYRAALPREKVLAEVAACAGAQFDPALAPVFITLDFSEYDAMVARHQVDQAQPLARRAA